MDRCAAYVAARGALAAVARAAPGWPEVLAAQARDAAICAVMTTAQSLGHPSASAARRRCLRDALASAIELAATCDVVRATGVAGHDTERAQRMAGRSIALLGLLLHASTHVVDDD